MASVGKALAVLLVNFVAVVFHSSWGTRWRFIGERWSSMVGAVLVQQKREREIFIQGERRKKRRSEKITG